MACVGIVWKFHEAPQSLALHDHPGISHTGLSNLAHVANLVYIPFEDTCARDTHAAMSLGRVGGIAGAGVIRLRSDRTSVTLPEVSATLVSLEETRGVKAVTCWSLVAAPSGLKTSLCSCSSNLRQGG